MPDSRIALVDALGQPPATAMDAGDFYAQSAEAAKRLGKRALLLIGCDALEALAAHRLP